MPSTGPPGAILDIQTALIVDADTFAAKPQRWDNAHTVPFQTPWMADPSSPASRKWRQTQAIHDRAARAFLADWREDIDIVYGLDEPDDRRWRPRLGPALTFAVRRALFYGTNHTQQLREHTTTGSAPCLRAGGHDRIPQRGSLAENGSWRSFFYQEPRLFHNTTRHRSRSYPRATLDSPANPLTTWHCT